MLSIRNDHDSEKGMKLDRIAGRLKTLLLDGSSNPLPLADAASKLVDRVSVGTFAAHSELLVKVCVHLFEIGQSSLGVSLGRRVADCAETWNNVEVQRRLCNMIGGQYCDIADFASALKFLETAVVLSRQLGNPTIEAACLSNVIAVLQEMGHYRQAILLAERILKLQDDTEIAKTFKLQCTSNGLFAAQRIGDTVAATRFLSEGQTYLSPRTDPLRRAFFEKGRSWYLVDRGEARQAKHHVNETQEAIGARVSPRILTLLTVSSAVCDWGLGEKITARAALEELYVESKASRLYHHFVLQALIKVFSDSETPFQASKGLAFGKELVEYTTSVKKAKFYRQLANRREDNDARSSASFSRTAIDSFNSVKDWLSASDIIGPGDANTGERRTLTKHEELTAIHEDMAKLRMASIRRDIRTDAVDTAENWAIAAEFFDDETGQHCYRVGHLASMLAREIGLNVSLCVQIEHAARLHDIGKIAVNEVILLKPGPLDASEMAAMRLHTEVGAQILAGSDDPTLKIAVEVARHHHEWWNGQGYPAKLKGTAIPISARICAFSDVYDALTHVRSYKKAWSHERALEEITRLAGTQFDPSLISPFTRVLDRYRADLCTDAIPGFKDMQSNTLIASRKKLMETIASGT